MGFGKMTAGVKWFVLYVTAVALSALLQKVPVLAETTRKMPTNPVHQCTAQNNGTDKTEWDYVYMGSYPQTEVKGNSLTSEITNASYDINGDAWVGGIKYRRISRADTNFDAFFGNDVYRYFKWERIKWRVMKNDGKTLFVVADQSLDCVDYNEKADAVTWEGCSLRSWLNDTFYHTAFSRNEQETIVKQNVVNADNPDHNTEGGNDTEDKIYLLSFGEATDPAYGFCGYELVDSASRRIFASEYSHAMGASINFFDDFDGYCGWWLRSPGELSTTASVVMNGYAFRAGVGVDSSDGAVVPAMHLDLFSDYWHLLEEEGTEKPGGNENNEETPSEKKPAEDQKAAEGQKAALKLKASLVSSNAVKLSWTNAEGAEIYHIYRSTKANSGYIHRATVQGNSYIDRKLKSKKTYYYKVMPAKLADVTMDGAMSASVSKKIIGPLAKPKMNVKKKTGNYIEISWKNVKYAQKIEIQKKTGKEKFKKWKTISAGKGKLSYSYLNFARNKKNHFRLRSYYQKDGIKVYSKYSNLCTITRK